MEQTLVAGRKKKKRALLDIDGATNTYLVRADGDSMTAAGILEWGMVVVAVGRYQGPGMADGGDSQRSTVWTSSAM